MYPYPELLSQLKVACSVTELMMHLNGNIPWKRGENSTINRDSNSYLDVLQLLPDYTYAICPICHTPQHDRINTYTLHGWGYNNDFSTMPYHDNDKPFVIQPGCPHYLGVHVFLNLHQQPPNLVQFYNHGHEVPLIIPWMLTHRAIPSFAVIHALPICRIEADRFDPTYTAFFVSYFLRFRKRLWYEHWESEAPNPPDLEWFPWVTDSTRTTPHHPDPYDLAEWTRRGVLGWLDYTQPNLPLRLGRGRTLPPIYTAIVGDKHPNEYRDGVTKQGSSW